MYQPYLVENIYPNVFFTAEENEERLRYYTDISTYVSNSYAKWMLRGGIEAEWDEYLKTLNAMGLERMVEIYQSAYDRYMSVQ